MTRGPAVPRMTDHQMQPFAIGQRTRERFQRRRVGLQERRAQQQVFRRVAAQGQFGCERHAGAVLPGGARGAGDQARIAVEIADGRVDLEQCDPHGIWLGHDWKHWKRVD